MGGINHQPCGSYLRLSTLLSKRLSLARSELELANNVLEDLILDELEEGFGTSVTGIVDRLRNSQSDLQGALGTLEDLRVQMKNLGYEDLPTLGTTDLIELGLFLTHEKVVENHAWTQVTQTMRTRGFYGMLEVFEQDISNLIVLTDKLAALVLENEPIASGGNLRIILEENRPGNFKVEFARLYSAWAGFQQIFLASSILSTELWYRFNDSGSLIDGTCVTSTN